MVGRGEVLHSISGMMPVIHNLGWYFPESSGGTEIYVENLIGELRNHNFDGTAFAPVYGKVGSSYTHSSVDVVRYPIGATTGRRQLRGLVPHDEFGQFVEAVRGFPGEIYHQHSWTTGCGLFHLRAAKKAGKKTVITIHTPGAICLRGTMMLQGERSVMGLLMVFVALDVGVPRSG